MKTSTGDHCGLDWRRAEEELQEITAASGGRLYSPRSTLDPVGIYDTVMEDLRVRYLLTYRSTGRGDLNAARSVRIEVVNPTTGGPLEIVDANGKPVRSEVFVETSYFAGGL